MQTETLTENRPSLDSPVRYLKGVGPKRSEVLARLGLNKLGDLFYLFPRRYEDRSVFKGVADLEEGERVCVRGVVTSRAFIRRNGGVSIFKVVLDVEGRPFFGTWFNQPYLSKIFSPKTKVIFYGKVEKEGKFFKMLHPEYEIVGDDPATYEAIHSARIVPIYPLTQDVSQKGLRQLLFGSTKNYLNLIQEFLPEASRQKLGLLDLAPSFWQIHFPASFEDLQKAYRRLVFNEFLMMQLAIQIKKRQLQNTSLVTSNKERGRAQLEKFINSLSFKLTQGQKKAIDEIVADIEKNKVSSRLLQGDVGSGKTVVAMAAIVFIAASDFQSALMAPTEVLAQQHYFTLLQLLEPLGISVGYLSQSVSSAQKQATLLALAQGKIQVIVGTHALIQSEVQFKNLGLAVIDEQHKFGVIQRASLKGKSDKIPHFLLMSATPIPQTLMMTLYGELNVSTINELPKDRIPIRTYWVSDSRRQEIYDFLESLLARGQQGYVICPAIDQTITGAISTIKDVTTTHEELKKIFARQKIGLLHGQMKSADKQKIMKEFRDKKIDILVSTVVIEVGVDVPNATVMIVENAEKFGLSQLHQLRGRVGRGSMESFCFVFSNSANEETILRLEAFTQTTSGFEIAQKDLEIRGAGDIVGAKQHGIPELRIGDLTKDIEILYLAGNYATEIISKDPEFKSPDHRLLKKAVYERFGLSNDKKITSVI